jgi:lysyl-tRNA synthetase class 2
MANNQQNNPPVEEETQQDINILKKIRLDKLDELKSTNRNPYEITKFDYTHKNAEIRANFETMENQTVRIAGRIMTWRNMGKANFINVRDGSDRMQVYVRMNDIGEEEFKEFKKWDIGDIVGVEGFVFKTRTGEISVHAQKIVLLSKSLLPLPEKWHGLKDTDTRYRQRYVDLICNPDVKDTFVKRSQILKEIRNYLDNLGYIEVDTPVLHTLEIGASARPFKTHHNALDIDMYLRIETELYLTNSRRFR